MCWFLFRQQAAQGNGVEAALDTVAAGDQGDGRPGADDNAGISGVGKDAHGFADGIADLVIGDEEDIRIPRVGGGVMLVGDGSLG